MTSHLPSLRIATMAVVLCAMTVPPLVADDGAPANPLADTDARVLESLASSDYEKRERAHEELLGDDSLTHERMLELFRSATVPEQRNRLYAVAMHHFVARAVNDMSQHDVQGALGVRLPREATRVAPDDPRSGIRIVQTYPGFPAFTTLRAGDLVLGINGMDLPPITQNNFMLALTRFVQIIQSHGPGDQLTFHIRRGEIERNVTVTLAGLGALKTIYKTPISNAVDDRFPATAPQLDGAYAASWQQLRGMYEKVSPAAAPLAVKLPEKTEKADAR